MRIHSIFVKNYRPFAILQEIQLGPLATIVGQNDTGKSSVLRALQLFFEERPKIEDSDVYNGAGADDDVIVEVAFTSLPEKITWESDVETTLQGEMLVDIDGHLRIRKTYPRSNLTKFNITLITHDFEDERFEGLAALKEDELNDQCNSVEIEVTKSGSGVTNKSKREKLRDLAKQKGIQRGKRELPLNTTHALWKKIASLMPEFVLFETDTKLGVAETTFQSEFRPIITDAAEQTDVIDAKSSFTEAIEKAIQGEIDDIFERLAQHTDAFVGLKAECQFSWQKAVTFQILGKDQYGVENSLDRRGSGMRRLLMVAVFQYLAEKKHESGEDFVFAVEEPENCLHPGLQRELVASFRRLADKGYQVIITSHSPVFAGASPIEDLALVTRGVAGVALVQTYLNRQLPDRNSYLSDVAEQLGVEPSDQITGYSACIFVEGITDVEFWRTVALKLKEAGHIDTSFDDMRIGFVLFGGDNLKHWIDLRAMCRLNRRFGVVVDSDRKSKCHNIPGKKLNWKRSCEDQGGIFFILKKREIENYLHPEAIKKSGLALEKYDDFTDMKDKFGNNVYKTIEHMTCDEILEMDCYEKNGTTCHELKEIIEEFLTLPYLASS